MTSQQPPLFTDSSTPPATAARQEPAPVWLQRMSLLILVLFCFYIGTIMVLLPWVPKLAAIWDHNGWLVAHPAIHAFVQQGWFRGILSGIGLIDIWIGISEAMHFRDQRRLENLEPQQPA